MKIEALDLIEIVIYLVSIVVIGAIIIILVGYV